MKSKAWQEKRQSLFAKRGKCCEQCGFEYYLHVHHKTYKNLGKEKDEDLQILCYQCHMSKHDKYFDKLIVKKTVKNKKRKKPKIKKPNKLKTSVENNISETEKRRLVLAKQRKKKEQDQRKNELIAKFRKLGIESISGTRIAYCTLDNLIKLEKNLTQIK